MLQASEAVPQLAEAPKAAQQATKKVHLTFWSSCLPAKKRALPSLVT